ncbi:vWA domain-containing protein [Haloferula sp.]|uniref:vWA domain-containing protein n=1 Tax=Haloferula sp. TaxID=2497595 RepID=UPI00329AA651
MSHVFIPPTPEQEAKLHRQRRNSMLTSVFIALLVMVLIGLILGFILLPSFLKETPVMVSYSAPTQEDDQIEQKKKTAIQAKPSAPSSSQSKIIAANTASNLAIPVPELEFDANEVSLEFGSGDDFGAGWAMGDGNGTGGGGTTFFKQSVVAQRVAYVIDASKSMNKKRQELMREELTKSVKQLKAPMVYQIIFFSGPAWVAGSEEDYPDKAGVAKYTDDSGTYEWRRVKGGFAPKGKEQPVPWLELDLSNRKRSEKHIEEQVMSYGTNWGPPLTMALEMDPPPQIIFFMTDGTGGNTEKVLKDLSRLAKRKNTIINTVALMEPKASEGLIHLARETKGQFTIVDERGRAKVQKIED